MDNRDIESIFSEKNLMLLGILDEVYDLYLECCNLIETEYIQEKDKRPDGIIWPQEYNVQCKKEIGKFFDNHIQLFSTKHHRMYVNNESLSAFSLWDIKKTRPLTLQFQITSFRSFLKHLELVVVKACWGKERKEKPILSIERVRNDMKNHILFQVEQLECTNRSETKVVDFSKCVHTIWVYRNTQAMSCLKEQHPLQFRTARILALQAPTFVEIVVRYCEECEKYFISEQTLTAFEAEYGIMLARKVYCKNGTLTEDDKYFNFCNESELHSMGYNVRANGMGDTIRRKLLLDLITKKVMSVEAIIRDIENALKIFAGRATFISAIKKWESDLVFLNEHFKRSTSVIGELKNHNQNTSVT